MVFLETDAGGDFGSIFASVAEERREEEERRQTLLFLRLLDEMEQRSGDRSAEEEEEEEKPRKRRGRKEFMRVSITDDDLAESTRRTDKEARDRKVGRVHTIKDLPHDDFDFFMPPTPEIDLPELSITSGRRVGDGKVTYFANFENFFGEIGAFKTELNWILLICIFLLGIYLGRRLARANNSTPPVVQRRVEAVTQQQTMAPQPSVIYYAFASMPPMCPIAKEQA